MGRGGSLGGSDHSGSYPVLDNWLFAVVEVLLTLPRGSVDGDATLGLDDPDSAAVSWVRVASDISTSAILREVVRDEVMRCCICAWRM